MSCSAGVRRVRRDEPSCAPLKSASRPWSVIRKSTCLRHFAHERQHGAQDFADGRDVVEGNPLGELEKLRRKDRLLVENVEDRFGFDRRRFVVDAKDDSG